MKRKLMVWLLIMVMVLSMAACGEKEEEGPAFVYVPEYITLPSDEDNSYISAMQLTGQNFYYSIYNWDEETGESSQDVYSLDLTASGAEPVKMDFDMQDYGDNMQTRIDAEGNVYLATRSYEEIIETAEDGTEYTSYDYEHVKIEVIKVLADGTVAYRCDLTDKLGNAQADGYISDYIQYMALDKAGNVYVSNGDTAVWVIGAEGQFLFEVPLTNWLNSMGVSKDGDVYIAIYGSNGNLVLQKIDVATKGLGQELSGLPSNFYGDVYPGTESDFLLKSDTTLYSYDVETKTYQEVLKFIDCDLSGSFVEKLAATEDGSILVYYSDWNTNTEEIVKLTKKSSSEVTQKKTITFGGFYISQDFQSSVVEFNKSSDEYRITIKDYSESMGDGDNAYEDALTLMNNDILTGNAPDIIDLSNINMQTLANKGVIEDLTPYLESSDKLSREDLVESVLEAYTLNDMLCGIPVSFSIGTVLSASSLVGEDMGWTLDEMLAVAETMPEDAAIMEYGTKDTVLQIMVMFGADKYVDWETGKCNFNSDDFVKLLEFANTFPKEYDYNEDSPIMPELVETGKLLLTEQTISAMADYQVIETIWGEPITCIGFPGGSGNGSALSGQDALAISAKSEYKDVAWEFIENYILEMNTEDNYMWGFPVMKDSLEAKFEEAMTPQYETDWETGEPVLDENGDPVEISNHGWSFGDGYEYNIYSASQEQVDAVKELINSTTTLYNADTEMYNIIREEAAYFFDGQKSAEAVAETIQGRIQIYVDEMR